MSAQQNQINLGRENCIPFIILFPLLLEIIAQTAHGTAKPFLNVCGCCQEMGALELFALPGIVWYQMSYQANLAVFGLSSALSSRHNFYGHVFANGNIDPTSRQFDMCSISDISSVL